jgi:hypothetical protein
VCERTVEALRTWQLSVYDALVGGYRARLSEYQEALAQASLQAGPRSLGRPPAVNQELARIELKRNAIALLRRQPIRLGAMQTSPASGRVPELLEVDFARADAQSPIVQFYEQAFDWTAMTYVLYPYYWARPEVWDVLALATDPDLDFERFLRAGATRLVVPVRPEFEEMIKNYLVRHDRAEPERVWITDAIASAEGGSPPEAIPADLFPVWAELADSLGRPRTTAEAVGSVTKASARVTLSSGRKFSPVPPSPTDEDRMAADDGRELYINGVRYVVKRVVDADNADLREPYRGATDASAAIGFAGKVIEGPWQIKLPTSLVVLHSKLDKIPSSLV